MSSPSYLTSFRIVTDREAIKSLTNERQAWTALWDAVTREVEAPQEDGAHNEPCEIPQRTDTRPSV